MDRKALYNLEYGVFMVSSRVGDRLGGCITNTCIQAAANPVRLAIACINGNFTPELIAKSGLFTVSVLDRTVSASRGSTAPWRTVCWSISASSRPTIWT